MAVPRIRQVSGARSMNAFSGERIRNSLQVGSILAFPVDVTKPFLDLRVPADIDRIHCFVSWRKQFIGTVALPVIAGEVSGAVVQDAVADAYCWQIIGAFLGETISLGTALQVSDGRASVHRNGLHLATWQSTNGRRAPTSRPGRLDGLPAGIVGPVRLGRFSVLLASYGVTRDGESAVSVGLREAVPEVVSVLTRDAQHRIRCEIGGTLPPEETSSDDLVEVTLGGALPVACRSAAQCFDRQTTGFGCNPVGRAGTLSRSRARTAHWVDGSCGSLRDRLIAREKGATSRPSTMTQGITEFDRPPIANFYRFEFFTPRDSACRSRPAAARVSTAKWGGISCANWEYSQCSRY